MKEEIRQTGLAASAGIIAMMLCTWAMMVFVRTGHQEAAKNAFIVSVFCLAPITYCCFVAMCSCTCHYLCRWLLGQAEEALVKRTTRFSVIWYANALAGVAIIIAGIHFGSYSVDWLEFFELEVLPVNLWKILLAALVCSIGVAVAEGTGNMRGLRFANLEE